MNKEEIELNAVLWERFTDMEIRGMEQRLLAQITPQKMMLSGKWMVRGLSDAELIEWLVEIRDFAPPHLMPLLLQICNQELSVDRASFIESKLRKTA